MQPDIVGNDKVKLPIQSQAERVIVILHSDSVIYSRGNLNVLCYLLISKQATMRLQCFSSVACLDAIL